ncbi:helix-turn-helix transcriptional regulator [Pilimelia columellifera]|uniref:HTH luxR-type domain-containing protein n=1 Tax=Pilimelia columellifera subsp. columellifera TaxID=706583 RepID=A0ABN3NLS4_9ACTN
MTTHDLSTVDEWAVPCVGRDRELAAAVACLDRPTAGRRWTAVVCGDPGIGKSRLLEEVVAAARARGVAVRSARAAEYERGVPFGVLRDALDGHLPDDAGDWLTPEQRTHAGAVFPRLDPSGPPSDLLDVERFRLYRALRALVEAAVAAQPHGLLLVLDDLHWADAGTLEFLDHLVRHPPLTRLTLAVGVRPRQAPALLLTSLTAAASRGEAVLVELSALDAAAADRLMAGWAVPANRRPPLYAGSAGNPLYLETLARADRHGAAPPLADAADALNGAGTAMHLALLAEFGGLAADHVRVAAAAAVAGDTVDPELLAAVSGLPDEVVEAALDALCRRDLVRPGPAGLRYRHPLLRSVAYQAADPGWRIGAHRRAYVAWRSRGADLAVLAGHVSRYATMGDRDAVAVLINAARASLPTAPAAAAHWLAVALRLLPVDPATAGVRLELLAMRVRALGVSGRLSDARDLLHEVLDQLPPDRWEHHAQLTGFCAMLERLLGHHSEARGLLARALAALPDHSGATAATLLLELAVARLSHGEFGLGEDPTATALAIARGLDDPSLLAAAQAAYAFVHLCAGDLSADVRAQATAAATGVDAMSDGDLSRRLETMVGLGLAELFLERWSAAERHLARGLRVARATGQAHLVNFLRMAQGAYFAMRGRLTEAAECFEDAHEAGVLTGSAEMRTQALSQQGWIAIWRGELSAARTHIADAIALAGPETDWHSTVAHADWALMHLHDRDPRACVALFTATVEPHLARIDALSRPLWHHVMAAATALAGDPIAAHGWADRAEAAVAGHDLPVRSGIALLSRAYATGCDDPAAAADIALAAASMLEPAGARVFTGLAHLGAATALGASGRVPAAREHFARARTLFRDCGADGLHADAVRAQRRMDGGQRRRSHDADGPGDGGPLTVLTSREREITMLVCAGLSNPEIGERLYLSRKTVEAHLRRVFAKLGVTGRTAVAAVVAAHSPDAAAAAARRSGLTGR